MANNLVHFRETQPLHHQLTCCIQCLTDVCFKQDGDEQGACAQQQGCPHHTVQGPGEWRQGEEEEEQQKAEQRREGATPGSGRRWNGESFLGHETYRITVAAERRRRLRAVFIENCRSTSQSHRTLQGRTAEGKSSGILHIPFIANLQTDGIGQAQARSKKQRHSRDQMALPTWQDKRAQQKKEQKVKRALALAILEDIGLCPISMEPMRRPVLPSSGQAFDEINIVRCFPPSAILCTLRSCSSFPHPPTQTKTHTHMFSTDICPVYFLYCRSLSHRIMSPMQFTILAL